MKDVARFIAGFKRFQKKTIDQDPRLFHKLKRGQHPLALFIACSDSRVDPALITDCAPGEEFVVRNVANLVPPYNSGGGHLSVCAALEFAVCNLKVEQIIVLGHANCGGIRALLDAPQDQSCESHVHKWMKSAQVARDRVFEELAEKPIELKARACEQASILISLENLLTYPWIREKAEADQLELYGWYFDIGRGEMLQYDPHTGRFEVIAAGE